MTENITLDGIPSPGSLSSWIYNNVLVKKNGDIGYIYFVGKAAFLSQFKDINKLSNKVNILINYRNLSGSEIRGELVLTVEDNKTKSIFIGVETNKKFEDYYISIPFETTKVIKSAFEIRTDSSQEVEISLINLSLDIEQEKEDNVSAEDLLKMQYCMD